ncbi:MAG: arginine repressor [Clostridia bacterium]|nr:arginine repressor [Clostridia bacterium]
MKVKRQAKILEIIQSRSIETQDELIRALEEAGYRATQATVSRDIKELRLIKILNGDGKYCYSVMKVGGEQAPTKFMSIFHDAVSSIDFAGNLVVVKCLSGMAQAACAAMDSLQWESVVGTLAGEDTFVCITRTNECAVELAEQLKELQRG